MLAAMHVSRDPKITELVCEPIRGLCSAEIATLRYWCSAFCLSYVPLDCIIRNLQNLDANVVIVTSAKARHPTVGLPVLAKSHDSSALNPVMAKIRPTEATVEPPTALKKRTKSRNGCVRCKDKRVCLPMYCTIIPIDKWQRKCDEAKPGCDECTRRNLSCPGYKKEIKWSLRHEKTLRREQPKSRVRRASSLQKSLFTEATAAIQQDDVVTASPEVDVPHRVERPSPTTADVIQPSTAASGGIDEHTLRDFLLRSDQAFENFTPWYQHDSNIPVPLGDALDISEFNFDVAADIVAEEATGGHPVDLDGLDVSAAQPMPIEWSMQLFNHENDEETVDEEVTVRQSLASWKKYVSKPAPTSLVDVTTFLVDHWFREVCPQWSAFDSSLNPNRVHISQIWTNSKAVLHSMKTMAATCLMSTLPHLKHEAITSARISVQAIGEDLAALELENPKKKLTVPLDLCLALLCVGTTMCWLDTNLHGLAYWKEARRLRDFFNDNYHLLDEEEKQKLMFFENSCVYWDMLCSVVSNESLDVPLIEDAIIGCPPPTTLVKPHPWTGVAYKQQRLLSRTITLVRRHRLGMRKTKAKGEEVDSTPAAEDLMDAYILSNELENMEVPTPQSVLDMGDKLSPSSHFTQLAIAFRLAALLQLHLTFRLEVSAIHISDSEVAASQQRHALKLALELCSALEEIPVTSNTRCTQPILYITAASGLRFETPPTKGDPFSLTSAVLEVHRARSFILDRFANLQRSLPPKPIMVAAELVQAIWRGYEDEGIGMDCHWIDVMIDKRLSTLFG